MAEETAGKRRAKGLGSASMRWPHLTGVAVTGWSWVDVALGRVPQWPEALGLGAWLGALAWAAMDMRAQGFLSARTRGPEAGPKPSPRVALTFDDGPDPNSTPRVLASLARRGAPAAFFMVGHKVAASPHLARTIQDAGHEVACHGHAHDWRAALTVQRAQRDVQRGCDAVVTAVGAEPRYYRPPYGVTTPALALALATTDLQVVGWSVRALDTLARRDVSACVDRVLREARPGSVILMHDAPERRGGREPLGPEMVEPLLDGLAQRGLQPAPLADVLG